MCTREDHVTEGLPRLEQTEVKAINDIFKGTVSRGWDELLVVLMDRAKLKNNPNNF